MILIINAGSSSIKYALFDGEKLIKKDKVERIGEAGEVISHAQAWEKLYQGIGTHRQEIKAVGHRIVHGGDKYREPIELNVHNIADLQALVPLAPLHMKAIVEVVEITMAVLSHCPHIGVFDTAFFADLPARAATYPLPLEIREKFGIKRYGFHGISHQWALQEAQEKLGLIRTQRMVSIHLGAGCSIAAIKEGKCVDTSMGYTPLEGLMMMTRPGDLDSGVVLKMWREGMAIEEVEKILNQQSGLYGVSGLTRDMRDLLYVAGYKVEDKNYLPPESLVKNETVIENARLAIDMFTYRIAKYIGAYAVALSGLDAIVFTGAIGAGSAEIRNIIVNYVEFLDEYELLVVEPNEELEMAHQVMKLLNINVAPPQIEE